MKLNIKVLILALTLTLISILNVFIPKSIQRNLIYSLSKMDISRLILIPVLGSILISGSVLGYIDINFNLTELILRRLQSVNLISSLILTLILGYINFDALKLILRGLRAPP